MKKKIWGTRRRKVASCVAALMLPATVALAAWLVSGEGPVTGSIASLAPLTVEPGVSAAAQGNPCRPGGTCAASVKITNPAGNGALVITSISQGAGPPSGAVAGCVTGDFTSVVTQSGMNIPLPTGASEIVIPGAFALAANAPSACQGVNFQRSLKVTAATP